MKKKSKFPEKVYITLDCDEDDNTVYPLAWSNVPDEDGPIAEYKLVRVGKIKIMEPTAEWQ